VLLLANRGFDLDVNPIRQLALWLSQENDLYPGYGN
jgi:hypothetical protein